MAPPAQNAPARNVRRSHGAARPLEEGRAATIAAPATAKDFIVRLEQLCGMKAKVVGRVLTLEHGGIGVFMLFKIAVTSACHGRVIALGREVARNRAE